MPDVYAMGGALPIELGAEENGIEDVAVVVVVVVVSRPVFNDSGDV